MTPERLRRPALLAVLSLLAGALSECGGRRQVTTLRLAQADDLYSLDPDAAADSRSRPDDRTWDFELRPGVRFHDGRVLTSADVKFSLQRVGGGASPDPVA